MATLDSLGVAQTKHYKTLDNLDIKNIFVIIYVDFVMLSKKHNRQYLEERIVNIKLSKRWYNYKMIISAIKNPLWGFY